VKQLNESFVGRNNENLEAARNRLIRGNTYRDLSTVCIVATRGMIPAKVVSSWLSMATPMNQKFVRIFVEKMEVADAYNTGVEIVMNHPELSKWRFLLTIEEDNCPPQDGLLMLYESIDKFDAISGLYWVKGENGSAMCYGNPKVMPKDFVPQIPIPDTVMEVNGIGQGFALFKMDIFKRVQKPWFKTLQHYVPGQGMTAATQDLYFCMEAAKQGCRFAVDTRCRVGHWDQQNQTMW